MNTYTGIDIANFTNGIYNGESLFEGDNLACFAYQTMQQAIPDAVSTSLLSTALALIDPIFDEAFGALACPQLQAFNDNDLPPYPGRSYSPDGPATNC